MKALFLTEGGVTPGFGHVTRCVGLSAALKKKKIISTFLVHGDRSITGIMGDVDYVLCNWPAKEKEVLVHARRFDIVILDSYHAGVDLYRKISRAVKLAVYFDDTGRLLYPQGIVVNGSIGGDAVCYPKKKGVTYLLGERFASLRKEFWHVPKRIPRKVIKNIMVTLGGGDINRMMLPVLAALTERYPEAAKMVVLGRAANEDMLREACDGKTSFISSPDASKMKALMVDSDIAISAGGQTSYELARVGVPTVTVSIADNQIGNVKGWVNAGVMDYAGSLAGRHRKRTVTTLISGMSTLADGKKRGRMSSLGQRHVDGAGAQRIAAEIIGFMRRRQ